jgi:hypothetical protein
MIGIISIDQSLFEIFFHQAAFESADTLFSLSLGQFNQTFSIGCQLRVDPLQRSGWRCLAFW